MTPSLQSQAEAMAREVFKDALRIFGGENISEDAAFVKAISTALSKLIAEQETSKKVTTSLWNEKNALIAENERLKAREVAMVQADPRQLWNLATFELKDQLTATQAKLEKAQRVVLNLLGQVEQGGEYHSIVANSNSAKAAISEAKAFLSTLTAEKKEYEPPNPEPLHWECKCGCFNRFYKDGVTEPCVECGAEKKESE